MTGSGRGMKGVPIAISSFFPSPSGYKKSPGKFLGNDIAMVIVVEEGGKDSIYGILKMQVS